MAAIPSVQTGGNGEGRANLARANGTFTLKNSIFAGGRGAGGNGNGTFVDAGQNISDDNSITLNGTAVSVPPIPNWNLKFITMAGDPHAGLNGSSPAINAASGAAAPQ